MNWLLILLNGLYLCSTAQTVEACKLRFQKYLNFNGSLNKLCLFEKDGIYLVGPDSNYIFSVYKEELPTMERFFKEAPLKNQTDLILHKGNKRYSQKECDSLLRYTDSSKHFSLKPKLPIKGRRIAIDPGHFGVGSDAVKSEMKFLSIAFDDGLKGYKDTVKLLESHLNFQTAIILKGLLEEQGAVVMLTRSADDFTSFECNYADWKKKYLKKTIDSLLQFGIITIPRAQQLLKMSDRDLFWDLFRDIELTNRVDKINAFKPDITVIIHYNVDEKNAPWKQFTDNNYTMAFIPGAFTQKDLGKTENKADFFRLLLSQQVLESEKLALETVKCFNRNLDVPVANSNSANYLKQNCIATTYSGVYCRNLVMCRKINSTLVYGESLYQDNKKEALQLVKKDIEAYGVTTSKRVITVARSYFESIMTYLNSLNSN
jgi:N-acetylmuramoyl-L-alanine amidase